MAPVSISTHIGGVVLSFAFADGEGVVTLSGGPAPSVGAFRVYNAGDLPGAYRWIERHLSEDLQPAANATISHFEDLSRILQKRGVG